jgi:hypothetical protein
VIMVVPLHFQNYDNFLKFLVLNDKSILIYVTTQEQKVHFCVLDSCEISHSTAEIDERRYVVLISKKGKVCDSVL